MQRRKFLHRVTWLSGGLLVAGHLPVSILNDTRKKLKGRVIAKGKGLANVIVSDGFSVVATDGSGKYELELHANANAVFISTPSGYAFKQEKGIARHYYLLTDFTSRKVPDFNLEPLGVNDNEHQFIIWADPQVKNAKDVEKMMTQSVPDVQKLVAGGGTSTLMHGITVGDIVWDELKLFADYDRAVSQMGIPFFQCLGNHDMDYNKGGDEASDDTFQKTYGPTYYSFNRGKVHYVIMDDVRYLGKDREYDGHISQQQLDWLQKDLSHVPKSNLVILCVHIPVHSGVKNNEQLYALLHDRQVHIMSGHTHYHKNVIKGNIYEHNHGTVCGAWWTGPICGDGTPCGYGVYKVNGTDLRWYYQSTGEHADHQMKIFIEESEGTTKMQVNIWNHDPAWKTEYWVDNEYKGPLKQVEAFDPQAYATLLGPELPKPRGFAEPRKTEHMFVAEIPSNTREIRVSCTDRFGKKYTASKKIMS